MTLAAPPCHRDRCLITQMKLVRGGGPEAEASPLLHLINCHLTAGPEPGRRLRQVHDALDWLRKDINKRDLAENPPPPPQPKKPKAKKNETATATTQAKAPPPPPPPP